MKIRAQLVLACFLLSVLPLSVIVVYSYESSRRALEAASRREADARTRQMDRRLATIRGDLQQRLAEVSSLPMPNGASDRTPDVGNILMTMGDAASLVDSLEIQPVRVMIPQLHTIVREEIRHATNAVPTATSAASHNAPPGVEEPAPPGAPPVALTDDADPDSAPDAAPGAAPEAMIPGMPPPPKLPKFMMAPEQRQIINQIAVLGSQLGEKWQSMTAEERSATDKKIHQLQQELNA